MHFLVLAVLGFSGLTTVGLGTDTPVGGVTLSTRIDTPLVPSSLVESHAPASAGIFIPIHKPSHFPFVTIVKDDGTGPAGGWQAAVANLPFQKFDVPLTLITWYCKLTIGMPIRHSARGYISPAMAASMSAAVTNSVASRMNFDLPQGSFVTRFAEELRRRFQRCTQLLLLWVPDETNPLRTP